MNGYPVGVLRTESISPKQYTNVRRMPKPKAPLKIRVATIALGSVRDASSNSSDI
jgi:hypothetical protein